MSAPRIEVRPVAGWVVVIAVAGTVGIALGAFWLSFTALTNLTVLAGVPAQEAWVWPLIVDGIIVVATISVVALSPHGHRATLYPWVLLIAGAVVSVAANTAHALVAADASVPKPLAAGVSAVPPIVLLAITHLTVELTRRTRTFENEPSGAIATNYPVGSHAYEPALARAAALGGGRREKASVLRSGGWSNRRIAQTLNVHPSTVGRWLQTPLAIEGRPGSQTSDEQEARSNPE